LRTYIHRIGSVLRRPTTPIAQHGALAGTGHEINLLYVMMLQQMCRGDVDSLSRLVTANEMSLVEADS